MTPAINQRLASQNCFKQPSKSADFVPRKLSLKNGLTTPCVATALVYHEGCEPPRFLRLLDLPGKQAPTAGSQPPHEAQECVLPPHVPRETRPCPRECRMASSPPDCIIRGFKKPALDLLLASLPDVSQKAHRTKLTVHKHVPAMLSRNASREATAAALNFPRIELSDVPAIQRSCRPQNRHGEEKQGRMNYF